MIDASANVKFSEIYLLSYIFVFAFCQVIATLKSCPFVWTFWLKRASLPLALRHGPVQLSTINCLFKIARNKYVYVQKKLMHHSMLIETCALSGTRTIVVAFTNVSISWAPFKVITMSLVSFVNFFYNELRFFGDFFGNLILHT